MLTYDERMKIIRKFLEEDCLPILESKNLDYTGGSEDANNGFKAVAEMAWTDKYQVWAIFFFKHFFALRTWLKTRTLSSESIKSRIVDLINYLLILWSLLEEDRINGETTSKN